MYNAGLKAVIPVFTIIGRNGHEVYISSKDVSGETVARIESRHVDTGSSFQQPLRSINILGGKKNYVSKIDVCHILKNKNTEPVRIRLGRWQS